MKEYVCKYKYCLHKGEKIPESDVVLIGKNRYHWDCATVKQQIDDIKNTYFERIDGEASFPVLSKVLNDLVFKYGQDVDYIQYAVEYYARMKMKIKSPFSLLYLRQNDYMKEKWERHKKR